MAKRLLNEEQVSSLIYRMVRESLEAMPSNFNFEEDNKDYDNNGNDEKKRGDKYRQEVEAFFKQPGVNPAQYAYDLYGVKPVEGDDTNDMKNARSKFMKCLNHETNQDGYEYAFNSEEINKLKLMMSSNQVGGNMTNESKLLMNREQFNEFITEMVNASLKRILKEDFQKPSNWKDTPFNGTYQDENGALYMPDDDLPQSEEDEEDVFEPHGYRSDSNWGGQEIQLSNDGSQARFRDNYGTPGTPSEWLDIDFDENGVAFINVPNRGRMNLQDFTRYNMGR